MMETLDLRICRAVKNLTPDTMDEVYKQEGEEPYFMAADEADVYLVDNDVPRDIAYTEELMEQTLGFAIVDNRGRVHKKFKDLGKAEQARSTATINFDVSVEVEGDDDGEQE